MTDNAKPCLLYDNRFLDGTPTAHSTLTGFSASNIRDLLPCTWWYSGTRVGLSINGDAFSGASGSTPPTGWTALNNGQYNLGSGYLRISKAATNNPGMYRIVTLTQGKTYTVIVVMRVAGAAGPANLAVGYGPPGYDTIQYGLLTTTSATPVQQTLTFTSLSNHVNLTASVTSTGAAVGDFYQIYLYEHASIKVDCGSAKSADTLAIIGHNLFTVGATIEVYSSSDGTSWGERMAAYTVTSNKAILLKFTTGSYRHWMVKFNTTSTTAIGVAVCVLGVRMDFERFPSGNYDPAPEKLNGVAARSKAGHMIGATLQNIGIEIRAEFKLITPAWVEATFRPAWDAHLSQLLPFFFAWDSVNHPADVYFVTIPENFDLRMPYDPYLRSISLSMEGIKE